MTSPRRVLPAPVTKPASAAAAALRDAWSRLNLMAHVRHALGRIASGPEPVDVRPLEDRVDALEAMVEGLQDSVDRQARRQDERISELARRLEPSELARALSDDSRKRGL
jgi:hypothetical protein